MILIPLLSSACSWTYLWPCAYFKATSDRGTQIAKLHLLCFLSSLFCRIKLKLHTIVMRLLTRSWASLIPLLCVYWQDHGQAWYHCYAFIDKIMGKLDTIVMRLLTRSWASLIPLLCVYWQDHGQAWYHCYAFIDKIMGKLDTIVMCLLTRSWASLMPLLRVYCYGQTVFCDFVPNSREIVYVFLGHVG